MSIEVTASDVQAIILVDANIAADLTPFIEAGVDLAESACITDPLTGLATGYSAAKLKRIATWLAAHFYTILDPRMQSQNFGGAGGAMEGRTDFNLQGSKYGQQAMLLDTNGGLAWISEHRAKGKRGKVGMTSLSRNVTDSDLGY